MILQLRAAVTLDERDLLGPEPMRACSSLDDGPFCVPFTTEGDIVQHSVGQGFGPGGDPSSDVIIEPERSAQYVVDGVLSKRLRVENEGAFAWSTETYRTFSNLVSRVVVGQG